MLTVPQAAERAGKDPETIRRWVRAGRLHGEKFGTQWLIDEADLQDALEDDEMWSPPGGWKTATGEPMPNVVRLIRQSRQGR